METKSARAKVLGTDFNGVDWLGRPDRLTSREKCQQKKHAFSRCWLAHASLSKQLSAWGTSDKNRKASKPPLHEQQSIFCPSAIAIIVARLSSASFLATMILSVASILGVLFLGTDPTNSFAIVRPHSLVSSRSSLVAPPSTCLLAEQENEAEATSSDDTGASDTSSNDILNSPAFLKRKIDVLKSDIAQAEADTEEAKKRVEEGRAEWGPQLEDLQREVSFYTWDFLCSGGGRCLAKFL